MNSVSQSRAFFNLQPSISTAEAMISKWIREKSIYIFRNFIVMHVFLEAKHLHSSLGWPLRSSVIYNSCHKPALKPVKLFLSGTDQGP